MDARIVSHKVVEQTPHSSKSVQVASKLLTLLDYGGTALFAVVGTTLAGEKDMNLIGCTLVGCIAAMGGGSLNAMLWGSSSQFLDQPGVFWVRFPSYLVLTVGISIVTFYAWPLYCREMARQKVQSALELPNDHDSSTNGMNDHKVNQKAFVKACEKDPDIGASFAAAFGVPLEKTTPQQLFEAADNVDKTGTLSGNEIQSLMAKQFKFGTSTAMYVIDTLAMAAFAVGGVNGAVQRGLHPLVALLCVPRFNLILLTPCLIVIPSSYCLHSICGRAVICFTGCFPHKKGGILRDVLCDRNIAIGGQGYASAMGACSSVYVILRELRLLGFPCPLITRIVMAFATITTGVRVLEYWRGEPLLRPMHYYHDGPNDDQSSELLRLVVGEQQHDPAEEWLSHVKNEELVP